MFFIEKSGAKLSPSAAEDVVMGVISDALEEKMASRLIEIDNLQAYLITMVKNRIKDENRKSYRDINEGDLTIEDGPNFFDTISDDASRELPCDPLLFEKIKKTFRENGPECKEIIMLGCMDHSYQEISKIMDLAIGTVKSKMARCREKYASLKEYMPLYRKKQNDPI